MPLWYIIFKILSIEKKEIILKTTREKHQIIYKDKPIRIIADFSTKTIKARRVWIKVHKH
jgi:hypothetical protein